MSPSRLSRADVKDIVQRSYQYVAMFNVNTKNALSPQKYVFSTEGWNKIRYNGTLSDDNARSVAQPNNDVLYQPLMLDLTGDPIVVDVPSFSSKYASLETTAFDHYPQIPLSTSKGDFGQPVKLMFYSRRSQGFRPGDQVAGIDRTVEMTGDYVSALFRVMPHLTEPERFRKNVEHIKQIKSQTLSEYLGKPTSAATSTEPIPAYGKTDRDVFAVNFPAVMQFVLNHTTFDPKNEMDQNLLASCAKLGLVPGQTYDSSKVATIDGQLFAAVCDEVRQEQIGVMGDPAKLAGMLPFLFQTKDWMTLEWELLQSVAGPNGQPAREAVCLPVAVEGGGKMNARHDYRISMKRDELPPAKAFWSFTLYDAENGYFISNPQKKYSVGENAGYALNAAGGIDIHVAAEAPEGVPKENWLPITREDLNLNVLLRVYQPDLERFVTWKGPVAKQLK